MVYHTNWRREGYSIRTGGGREGYSIKTGGGSGISHKLEEGGV